MKSIKVKDKSEKRKKNLRFYLSIGILLLLSVMLVQSISNMSLSYINSNEFYHREEFNKNPQKASYWDLTGYPIFINDTDPSYSWNKTATDNDWISGTGMWNDPYIIENVIINGLNSTNCITIQNSDVHFIIKNSTLFNSSNVRSEYRIGIHLNNVTNGVLFNNIFPNNNSRSIFLEFSDNNTISNNMVSNNLFDGIKLSQSNDNVISNNTVSANMDDGITLWYSHNNTLSKNTLLNRNGEAIALRYSKNNTISMNTILNSRNHAIRLWYGSNNNILSRNVVLDNDGIGINLADSNNNKIITNTLSNNDMLGIYLGQSNNNTLSTNIISNNNGAGFWLHSGDNNLIFNNSLINNSPNANDAGTNNNWDNGSLGNYWDDYIGIDANDNGIGDTPYNITGSAGSQDLFPIWDDGPDLPEAFTLSSNAGTPERNGNFDLIWSTSIRADNYSVYMHSSYITEIIGDLTLLAYQTVVSPFPINDLSNGTYYFIVVAYNRNGQTLSNCILIEVAILSPDNGIPGYNVFFILSGIMGISVILILRRIKSEKSREK